MKIIILGPGCKSCINLSNNTQEALNDLGIEAEIIKVADY